MLFPSVPVPSGVYPNVVVEEEMVEETEGQQTLGYGYSIVETPIDTDSMFFQISAHISASRA